MCNCFPARQCSRCRLTANRVKEHFNPHGAPWNSWNALCVSLPSGMSELLEKRGGKNKVFNNNKKKCNCTGCLGYFFVFIFVFNKRIMHENCIHYLVYLTTTCNDYHQNNRILANYLKIRPAWQDFRHLSI